MEIIKVENIKGVILRHLETYSLSHSRWLVDFKGLKNACAANERESCTFFNDTSSIFRKVLGGGLVALVHFKIKPL